MQTKVTRRSKLKVSENTKKSAKKTDKLALDIINQEGEKTETVELNPRVFDGVINSALIHQAVVTYLSNQRKGLASTKTRGEVRGGGTKPWRQKGTGRARVGSIRSPLWRGGGVVFGPKPRSYYKHLPKKMKSLALKSAINAKLKDQQLLILNDLELKSHKTKKFVQIVKNLKLEGEKVQFVVSQISENLKRASSNLKEVSVVKATDIHTFRIIDCKKLVMTKSALNIIQERIERCLH